MPLPYESDVPAVLRELETSLDGLSDAEAAERLKQSGPNELEHKKNDGPLSIFLSQFKNPLILLLIVAGLLSLALGELLEALGIGIIILLNCALGFYQEYKAERALEALERIAAPQCRVLRNRHIRLIPASQVVPGDILVLEEGDVVAADGRLIECIMLKADESSLTGESQASEKTVAKAKPGVRVSDQKNMVFSGTIMTYGKGKAVVVATGMKTQLGQIAQSLQQTKEEPSVLERKFQQLIRQIGIIAGILVLAVVITATATGQIGPHTVVLFALTLLISTIPNSLPLVVTVSLSLGAKRLAGKNLLVKKLTAAESLGEVTIICSDKTGTLTKNQMTVTRIYVAGHWTEVTGSGYDTEGQLKPQPPLKPETLELPLRIGAICNNAKLAQQDGQPSIEGDPTEGALVVLAEKGRVALDGFERLSELPFDSDRKRMSVLVKGPDQKTYAYVKGAPDLLLMQCTRVWDGKQSRPLDAETKKRIKNAIAAMGRQALRVLGLAYKPMAGKTDATPDAVENNLIFVGLVGMMDAPRDEVPDAIARCKKAGIRVMMITGDHAATAEAVGQKIGLLESGQEVLDGSQLDDMTDAQLDARIGRVAIIARALPIQKLRIVESLKRQGHVVAMTGDGVNDAPALKRADIGIAMGRTGTGVAKEVAKAQLVDDNFASIVNAVEEGRNIYDKIIKSTRYLLSCNSGEIISVFLAILLFGKLALLPLQILLMNLLTDDFPALGLGTEPADRGIMERPPRKPGTPPLTKPAIASILLFGAVMAAGTLFMFSQYQANDAAKAQTVAFTTLVMFQLFAAVSCRSSFPFTKINPLTNLNLTLGVWASFAIQILVVHWAPLQAVFGTVALSPTDWAYIFAAAAVGFLVMEASKVVFADHDYVQTAKTA